MVRKRKTKNFKKKSNFKEKSMIEQKKTTILYIGILLLICSGISVQAQDPIQDYFNNYCSLINNYTARNNTSEHQALLKRKIADLFDNGDQTIVYNNLQSNGSYQIKLYKYLDKLLTFFPNGVKVSYKDLISQINYKKQLLEVQLVLVYLDETNQKSFSTPIQFHLKWSAITQKLNAKIFFVGKWLTLEIELTPIVSELERNMVYVEEGIFEREKCNKNNKVSVNSFRMNKYEVTHAEWKAVMGKNHLFYDNCDNCPVSVSWRKAQEFINKLNHMTAGNYRLPTEQEWEYAAIVGRNSRDYKYSSNKNTRISEDEYLKKIRFVGESQPNKLGLFDMDGNAWEWCADWYKGAFHFCNSPTHLGEPNDSEYSLILRGGSSDIMDTGSVSVYNGRYLTVLKHLGFRLVTSTQ